MLVINEILSDSQRYVNISRISVTDVHYYPAVMFDILGGVFWVTVTK
jgi:hypothetical protein